MFVFFTLYYTFNIFNTFNTFYFSSFNVYIFSNTHSSYVRADANLGGWMFEPIDNGRKTRATLIVCLDLKGNIPSFIINQITKTQPLCISSLEKIINQDVLDHKITQSIYIDQILNGTIGNKQYFNNADETMEGKYNEGNNDEGNNVAREILPVIEPEDPLIMEKRIVNKKVNAMLVKAVDLVNSTSSQWEVMFRQDGLLAENLNDGGNLITVRGSLIMEYPPYAIIKLINACNDMKDPRSYRKSPSMKSTKLLKQYDAYTSIRYLEMKGLGFVSGRDFVNVHHWRKIEDTGGIHCVAYAEERLDLQPELYGLVRAELIIAGYVLEPIVDNEDGVVRTKVTYVVKTDIKGSIPQWIVKIKSKEQPMQLLTLRIMLDEEAVKHEGGKTGFVDENMVIPEE